MADSLIHADSIVMSLYYMLKHVKTILTASKAAGYYLSNPSIFAQI